MTFADFMYLFSDHITVSFIKTKYVLGDKKKEKKHIDHYLLDAHEDNFSVFGST